MANKLRIRRMQNLFFLLGLFLLLNLTAHSLEYPLTSLVSNRPEVVGCSQVLLEAVIAPPFVLCLHHVFPNKARLVIEIKREALVGNYLVADFLENSSTCRSYLALQELLAHDKELLAPTFSPLYVDTRYVEGLVTGYMWIDVADENKTPLQIRIYAECETSGAKDEAKFPYSRPTGVFRPQTIHANVPLNRDTVIRLGTPPWAMSNSLEPNMGNYGLYYDLRLWFYNGYKKPVKTNCYAVPRGGTSSVLIQFEDGKTTGTQRMTVRTRLFQLEVPSGLSEWQCRSYQINGSNYPIDLIFSIR